VFGSEPQSRRPILLILVFGAFLALLGITATAQAVMVSTHFSASALNDVVGSDSATTRAFVNAYVQPRYLDQGGQGVTADDLDVELPSVGEGGDTPLRALDHVAYLRFASVYKGFEDLSDFEREVGELQKTTEPKPR